MSKTSPKRPARKTGRGFRFAGMGRAKQLPIRQGRSGGGLPLGFSPGAYPGFGPRLRAMEAAQRCGGMPALWSAAAFVIADALTASRKSLQRMPLTAAR
jgi:hypothetical protein